MKAITKYKYNNKFHTTLINVVYQFKCNKNEIMALTILSKLLSKTNKKYNDEGSFVKERLNRYIINYSVLNQNINNITFINFSLLIPNDNVIKEYNLNKSITFLLDTIYNHNLNDDLLFEKEKKLYLEYLLNSYKSIDFIAEKNMLDLIDSEGDFSTLKYKDIKNINDLTKNDVINVYNKYILNIKPKIFVNGNHNIDKLNNVFDKYFNKYDLKNNTIIKKYDNYYKCNELKEKIDSSKFYQSIVYLVYSVKDYSEKDYYKLLLLDLLLSSSTSDLLLKNLRKKSNLVYTSSSNILMNNGLLFIKAMTNKVNIKLVKLIIFEIIKDLNKVKKYSKHIENIINNYELNIKREQDNFYVISNNVINKYYKTDLTSKEELEELKNITLDEFKEFISRLVLTCEYTLEGEL